MGVNAPQAQKLAWAAIGTMVVAIVIVIAVIAWAMWQSATLGELNQKLTDANGNLQRGWASANATFENANSAIISQDNDLLLFMFAKMAEESENKSLSNISHVLSLMNAYADVAKLGSQYQTLCVNSTNSAAFNATLLIEENWTAVCGGLLDAMPVYLQYQTGAATIGDLQAALNGLFENLVELDNAIAKDP